MRRPARPRVRARARGEPGRPVERHVLDSDAGLQGAHPGVKEPEGLDDVAHRLVEIGLVGLGRTRCADTRAPAAQAAPQTRRAPPVPTLREDIGQVRRAGLIRAETISEHREGAHEIPLVTTLRREPRERLAQRLPRPSLVFRTDRWVDGLERLGGPGLLGLVIRPRRITMAGSTWWRAREGHGG